MGAKRDHSKSSGNVFADLGLPEAEEALAKAELAHRISAILGQRRLTQAQAARVLGVDQPKVSAITRGRLSGFSLARMVRFLILLGRDIEIVVKPRPRNRSKARLLVA